MEEERGGRARDGTIKTHSPIPDKVTLGERQEYFSSQDARDSGMDGMTLELNFLKGSCIFGILTPFQPFILNMYTELLQNSVETRAEY